MPKRGRKPSSRRGQAGSHKRGRSSAAAASPWRPCGRSGRGSGARSPKGHRATAPRNPRAGMGVAALIDIGRRRALPPSASAWASATSRRSMPRWSRYQAMTSAGSGKQRDMRSDVTVIESAGRGNQLLRLQLGLVVDVARLRLELFVDPDRADRRLQRMAVKRGGAGQDEMARARIAARSRAAVTSPRHWRGGSRASLRWPTCGACSAAVWTMASIEPTR